MPDNKRYIGDVFIDGKTDRLLQEFLTNLFNQYNGEGKGFNADMLDGHHYSEIEDEIARLDSEKLSTIVIGNSVFNANHSTGYLHFSDIIYDDYTELPWKSVIPTNYNITQTLTDLFQYINNTIDNKCDLKVDKEQVDPEDNSDNPRMKVLSDNNFTDEDRANLEALSEGLGDSLVNYVDERGVTHKIIDNQLTNGLRFILITSDDYYRMKNSEDTNERNYIDYWRNIFIIKDADDMPDAIEYDNPYNYRLSDGYAFRLSNDSQTAPSELNNIDPESNDPVWLQFKHNWASDWTNIVPLEDMLFGANFDTAIKTYIEGYDDYKINETSLINSLKDITQTKIDTNWSDYPFLSSTLHNDYVKQLTFNNSGQYVTSSVDANQFKNVDINLTQILKDNKVLKQNGTNNIDSINSQVSTNTSNIGVLQTKASSLTSTVNSQGNSISSLQQTVSPLPGRVSALESQVNKQYKLLKRVVDGERYDIRLYTNNQICFVSVRWNLTLLSQNPYNWEMGTNWNDWPVAPYVVADNAWYRPLLPVSFLDLTGKVQFIIRDIDGRLYYRNTTGKTIKAGDFYGSVTYVPRGLLP